jgi:hypothetical protein
MLVFVNNFRKKSYFAFLEVKIVKSLCVCGVGSTVKAAPDRPVHPLSRQGKYCQVADSAAT